MNDKNINILSSQFTNDYVAQFEIDEANPLIKKATDSVKIVESLLTKNKIETDAHLKAIQLLDKNQTVLVGNTTTTVSQLNELTTYYTNKCIELNNKVEDLKHNEEVLSKQLIRLKSSLKTKEEKESEAQAMGKLVLKLMSKSATIVTMDLKYLVHSASWSPFYEVRGESISQPLEVIFKAMVQQQSGLDWKGVQLTLINGVSSGNNNAPEVQSWFLYTHHPATSDIQTRERKSINSRAEAYLNVDKSKIVGSAEILAESVIEFTANSNQLNVSYDVDVPYDIKSNGEDHLISLYSRQVPAKYEYFTAPNYSPDAYLLAKVEDFSKYGLVQAPASIVFENMYIGETTINPNMTKDELDVTLGNDKRISIKRVNVKDKSGEKFLSNYKEKTITYDLEIKNNKKEAIQLQVKDRIPLSTQENIKVELLEDSEATVDEEKGFLSWDVKMAAAETKKIRVSYKVRYPKDVMVDL